MLKIPIAKDIQGYIIREAVPEDASRLIDYLKIISFESDNLSFEPSEMDITVEDEAEFIKNVAQSSNQYLIIAELKGRIIGNLTFTSGTQEELVHMGELEISVLKKYWRNGIAFELISNLIQWAKDNGKITKLNLQVRSDNKSAITLYRKLGFEIEKFTTRTFFIDNEYNISIKYYNSYQMMKIIS
ncbi:MAG: GNAT family N-acetyltransferase [Acidaminobacteraceae bacterium]